MTGVLDSTVMWLTLRQLFVRGRVIAAGIFALIPSLAAVSYRISRPDDPGPIEFLVGLFSEIATGTLLPLAALVFGTTAFGGEIDEGTVVYLLVKPLPRWRVVLSKYVVAVTATLAVLLPGILLPWLIVGPSAVPSEVVMAFAVAGASGACLYCGLFVMLGITTRRSLVIGLAYVIPLEFVLSRSLTGVKSLSIREYVLTAAGKMSEAHPELVEFSVPLATVWTMGTIILVGSIVAAIAALQRFEMAERL